MASLSKYRDKKRIHCSTPRCLKSTTSTRRRHDSTKFTTLGQHRKKRGHESEHCQACSEGTRLLCHWLALSPRLGCRRGQQNSGGMHYFSKVLEKIGCCVPPSRQLRFFDTRDHQNTSKAPCVRCGGTDHKRSNSKKCRFFKGRKLPSGEWLCFSCLSCSVF